VTGLDIEAGAAEAGFDPDRLQRIDEHFARYVADGRLPGWLLTVSRHGRLVHVARCGSRDLEAGLPVTDDTLWRIYSMTKPVTSVAAMILYEEGRLALTDPVSAFIPAFADVRVFAGGSDLRQVTVPAVEPVRRHDIDTSDGRIRIRITQVEVTDVGRDAFDAKLHGRPRQCFRRINIRSRCRPRQRTKLPHPFTGAPQTFTAGRQNADSWRAALH